ncbi:MAG TPA: hypothetical protein VGM19_00420 [Armatimonadota bacterium]|jgi:hypothetical protein
MSNPGFTPKLPAPPVVALPWVSPSPFVDGCLKEDAWQQAGMVENLLDITSLLEHHYHVVAGSPPGFLPEPEPPLATPATRVLLGHDGVNLYLGFHCAEPHPEQMLRRDRPLGLEARREDCVYAWLDPTLQHLMPEACEYVVNAAGQKSETRAGQVGGDYLSLMSWEGRVSLGAEGWQAELVVPLERLGLAREQVDSDLAAGGLLLGLNLGRGWRGDQQTHAWLAPDGSFMPGWGYAVLLPPGVTAVGADAQARVEAAREAVAERLTGRRLASAPAGLAREPGDHLDANAKIGLSVWGPDHQPTLSVGRSDVYDRRWYGNEEPAVTRSEVIAAAQSGDPARLDELRRRACGEQYEAYQQFPGPKPVGQIIWQLPGGAEAGWRTEVSPGEDGAVDLDCRRPGARLRLHLYVHKRRPLVVVEGRQEGLTGQTLGLRLYRHQDAPLPQPWPGYDYLADQAAGRIVGPLPAPVAAAEGDWLELRQDLYPDDTFPEGFAVVLAGSVTGAEPVATGVHHLETNLGTPASSPYEDWSDPMTGQLWRATHWRHFNAQPGSAADLSLRLAGPEFRALFPVVTSADQPDPAAEARRVWAEAQQLTAPDLEADSQTAPLAERVGGYRYQQKLAMTSIFDARFCFQDTSAWHADFHFNEFAFRDELVSGETAQFEDFFQMIEENLPAARALAREAFGCAGAAWGVASFPRKLARMPMTNLDWDYSLECSGLLAQPFWLAWLYDRDESFLRDRAYPVVREVARFYADYLTRETDGLYHLWPCTSSEHVMLQPYLRYNRDSQAGLAMAKFTLRAALEGARHLQADADLAPHWQEVLEHLAPYPLEMTPAGPRFVDVAGARLMTEYNIFQPLFCVFYGDDLGLASAPEELAVAERTLAGLVRLSTTHWGHVYRAQRRLGRYPGGEIVPENLLQSHQGPLFLFPAVPEGYTGSFADYHARGGFRVAATLEQGRLTELRLTSTVGGPCVLDRRLLPPEASFEGPRGAEVAAVVEGDRYVCLDTLGEGEYRLRQ